MEPRLRAGTVSDVEAIAHVHRLSRAWYYGVPADPADDREAMWAHLLAEPGRLLHVAEGPAGITGFLSATRPPTLDDTLELTALYVLPDWVGLGVGPRLHEQYDAERRAHEQGLLEVWAGNVRATTFYVRRGWTPTPATRPGPQGLDFVTYRLPAGRSRP